MREEATGTLIAVYRRKRRAIRRYRLFMAAAEMTGFWVRTGLANWSYSMRRLPVSLVDLLLPLLLVLGSPPASRLLQRSAAAAEPAAGAAAAPRTDVATIRITRDFLQTGLINPMQYGQFIEYLCNLVPSMWAEKLFDGGFEGLTPYKVRVHQANRFPRKTLVSQRSDRSCRVSTRSEPAGQW